MFRDIGSGRPIRRVGGRDVGRKGRGGGKGTGEEGGGGGGGRAGEGGDGAGEGGRETETKESHGVVGGERTVWRFVVEGFFFLFGVLRQQQTHQKTKKKEKRKIDKGM